MATPPFSSVLFPIHERVAPTGKHVEKLHLRFLSRSSSPLRTVLHTHFSDTAIISGCSGPLIFRLLSMDLAGQIDLDLEGSGWWRYVPLFQHVGLFGVSSVHCENQASFEEDFPR
jgi:hypothetical protein